MNIHLKFQLIKKCENYYMQTTEPSSISSPEKSAQQQTPREEPKKREKHTLKLPQELGGRFNSVWLSNFPNLEATDTFYFCAIVTLPCELLASTATCVNTEARVLPTHRVQQSAFYWFQGNTSQHCFIPPLPPLEETASSRFPLTLSCHSLFSSQFHCFTFTKSRIEASKNQKLHSLYETTMRTSKGLQ